MQQAIEMRNQLRTSPLATTSPRPCHRWINSDGGYGHLVSGSALSASRSLSTLSSNAQRARYGVSYVRNVCAQAGLGLTETSPDEDVLAVDCTVDFRESPVRVQVKCTSGLTLGGQTKSYRLKPEWLRKWDASKVPVYFVIVVVPRLEQSWLTHQSDGTFHKTAAFWKRVPSGDTAKSIAIPKSQRLTAETMYAWHEDLLAAFTPAGT